MSRFWQRDWFPEGPAFDSQSRLWFVELKGNICRLDGEKVVRIPTGVIPMGWRVGPMIAFGFVMPFKICDIRVYDPRWETFETICAQLDEPLNKPDDLAFDRVGNLLFTTS